VELTGYTPEEYYATPLLIRQLIAPDLSDHFEEEWARVLAGEVPPCYEYQIVHKSGDIRWINQRVVLIRNDRGEPVALEGISSDMTATKQTEQALKLAKTAADAANRAKSEFLANMSHEIRTPLTAIIGFTDLLQETEDRGLQQKYLDMIRTSGDILMSMIRDVLDLAKIESGKLELEMGGFVLAEVVERSIAAHATIARQRGVAFSTWIDPTLPAALFGDAEHLRQILANLVSNAVKFTHEGEITLSIVREGPTNTSAAGPVAARTSLHFCVQDTGIGIPEEKQTTIYDSFTQADGSTTRKYGGTGLGTTIAKGLAELMGGRIWLDSAPGVGTAFHVVIPFADAGTAKAADNGPHPGSALARGMLENRQGPLSILLVEDNPFTQRFVGTSLQRFGHLVTTAENGRQAVELWLEKAYDLVLMDVQLPEMNGLEATREIRRLEQDMSRHTPIIAMTANAFKEDRQTCLEAGMDDYLTKPITVAALLKNLLGYTPEVPARKPEGSGNQLQALAALFRQEEMPVAMAQDGAQLREFAQLLLKDMERSIETVAAMLPAGDLTVARRAAHTLKGVAAHLREGEIRPLAIELEQAVAAAAVDRAADLVTSLQTAYRRLAASIPV
jgi:PAS domain S-box-containing protein